MATYAQEDLDAARAKYEALRDAEVRLASGQHVLLTQTSAGVRVQYNEPDLAVVKTMKAEALRDLLAIEAVLTPVGTPRRSRVRQCYLNSGY